MKLTDLQKYSDWTKVWSGKWSLNSDSNFGEHWTIMDKVAGRPAYDRVIYVYKEGITDCWVREADKDKLGQRLISVFHNTTGVKKLAVDLKNSSQEVLNFLKLHKRAATLKEYNEFWNLVGKYYLPHLSVKYIVDYFSSHQLDKFLPILEEARLFAEPVFRETENFMEKIATSIAKQTGYSQKEILSATREELIKYFQKGFLPSKAILKSRYARSAVVFNKGQHQIFSGRETDQVERILLPKKAIKIIKGSIAYPGLATGPVRVVVNPKKSARYFQAGEILVSGMTRPEFLPIMKKATAFITDAGGILSHAAIVARELKKPCVIGTKISTKVLKDGDLVEVDANQGLVKILKKL